MIYFIQRLIWESSPSGSLVQTFTACDTHYRAMCSWCSGTQDAQVLSVRWHCQHCQQDGVRWSRWANCVHVRIIVQLVYCTHYSLVSYVYVRMTVLFTFPPTLMYVALRIHMSDSTASILEKLGGYHFECRGEREVKVNKCTCTRIRTYTCTC